MASPFTTQSEGMLRFCSGGVHVYQSLLSTLQLWLTFAPVADKTAVYFHISLEMVNWLSIVYLLISIPFGLVATWVLDSLGLRCALMRNKPYIILAVCFGGGIGMFTCFSVLLEQILCENGYSNEFAGLNGALFTVCGLLGAFLLGLYVDRTRKFIESTKICFCLSALASIVFAVVSSPLPCTAVTLAITSSLFGFFGFAIYPIAMELAVECSYPVGEGTSTGLIFVASQIEGVILMILLQGLTIRVSEDPSSTCALDQDGALDWTTPVLVLAGLCSAMACFYVIFFHTDYKRLRAETNSGDLSKPGQKGDARGPVREGLRSLGRDHDCKCSAGTLAYQGPSLEHLCCASLNVVFIFESGL
uniref:Solute carrier family 49 member 3 n=1 Tax=Strigops habroptila TaxID=2489341 RepID=A0A672TMC6_STRHB